MNEHSETTKINNIISEIKKNRWGEREAISLVYVKKITNDLSLKSFDVLLDKIKELEQIYREEAQSETQKYCNSCSNDSNLGDFYDNEVASVSRGLTQKLNVLNKITKFILEIKEAK